ncbi:MAG: DUF2590 family protein [Peptococcaceae bacterium]|jgi:uncharacterized membrane protein|nr:DUF2590 family protein [Peptococcaceae bacterium]
MSNEQLGTDISLVDMDFVVKADGDIDMVSGRECLAQDLKHMVLSDAGIQQYLKDEATEINKLDFQQAIVMLLETDPRVVPGTAACEVSTWERDNIQATASFQPIDDGNPMNLVLGYDLTGFTVEVLTGG